MDVIWKGTHLPGSTQISSHMLGLLYWLYYNFSQVYWWIPTPSSNCFTDSYIFCFLKALTLIDDSSSSILGLALWSNWSLAVKLTVCWAFYSSQNPCFRILALSCFRRTSYCFHGVSKTSCRMNSWVYYSRSSIRLGKCPTSLNPLGIFAQSILDLYVPIQIKSSIYYQSSILPKPSMCLVNNKQLCQSACSWCAEICVGNIILQGFVEYSVNIFIWSHCTLRILKSTSTVSPYMVSGYAATI